MASAKTLSRLDAAAWILVYGGLVSAVIGFTLRNQSQPDLGWALTGGGALAVIAGAAVIAVRARLRE